MVSLINLKNMGNGFTFGVLGWNTSSAPNLTGMSPKSPWC